MATIEEVRSKLKDRLGKFKVQTPTRVAYLGDGRGNATSNMVPVGEPNKFWARESLDGDKPFKITNKNPNLTPAFNLPVLLGYPEHDPETEQVLGLHSALIKLDAGGNVSGSSIGGTSPHHQKHEWGGGDTVYVDPRMFKPGLIAPTTPVSMRVKVLAFQHYYNFWRRYDGGVSPDLSQYIPDSDYRYVMLCLDPDTNQLVVHPGSVFTPDLSIDSIISNQATNTFRHIPVPPGNEIPLGVVLLEPDTTKVDWNPEGVNNLMPMRILLSSPMKEVNERLSLIESTTGISSLPQTGAANSVENDLLPGRIDGNITRLVLNRSAASASLPQLYVGEIAYVNDSPSSIVVGTASGNQILRLGEEGGASTLGGLDDVDTSVTNNQYILKYDAATSKWEAASSIMLGNNPSGVVFDTDSAFFEVNSPVIFREGGNQLFTTGDTGTRLTTPPSGRIDLESRIEGIVLSLFDDGRLVHNYDNGNGLLFYGVNAGDETVFKYNSATGFRFATEDHSSALDVLYRENKIIFNDSTGLSPLIHFDYTTNHVTIGSGLSQLNEGNFEIHSPSNLRLNSVAHFNHYSPTLNRATTYSYHFKNESGSMIEVFNQSFATVTASYGNYGFAGLSAGVLESTLLTIDTFAGEIVANNLGAPLDFRAESSANAQQFKVDAKLNAVQIGTSVAGQIADFREHLIEFNKNQNDMDVVFASTGSPALLTLNAGENRVSIGAVPVVNTVLFVGASNVNDFSISGNTVTRIARFQRTDGATLDYASDGSGVWIHNGAQNTGYLAFSTRTGGANTTRVTIQNDGGIIVGSPTGGGKGTGTINAQAVYDDNVLLTCYPIEYARTGSINLVEMDSKYGRGNKHTRAHDFSKKASKLINIKEYSNEWKTKGHLPLFPSREEWESRQQIPVGEMTQSMAETIELQAIHIDDLQSQIDELKSIVMEPRKK